MSDSIGSPGGKVPAAYRLLPASAKVVPTGASAPFTIEAALESRAPRHELAAPLAGLLYTLSHPPDAGMHPRPANAWEGSCTVGPLEPFGALMDPPETLADWARQQLLKAS